jgi:hypothetical protein
MWQHFHEVVGEDAINVRIAATVVKISGLCVTMGW